MQYKQDEWKLDFDYFRLETKKRGLIVSYQQASDFASHVAFLVMEDQMDLPSARKHAFNRVLSKEKIQSSESKFSILFIKDIPEDCHINELRKFAEYGLKKYFFQSGSVTKIEMLTIHCEQSHHIEYHGLVHIDSKRTNLPSIIRKLNEKTFLGKKVVVREYKQRFWQNDKRQKANRLEEDFFEKRSGDRRRGNVVKIIGNSCPLI